jgi:uridine kinase
VPPNSRLLIAVAGIPGSGKTTFSKLVAEGVNKKLGSEVALQVPMVPF